MREKKFALDTSIVSKASIVLENKMAKTGYVTPVGTTVSVSHMSFDADRSVCNYYLQQHKT